ncbi:sericin 1-like isoform X2 [Simochromis diagramma]|uniref:sericin 1-like isoform X2 n=1 Tax=Simochromis diagramma TaxID=43689 RepID=UPI001A7EAC4F|nr:sericin 1-like isoform X2 [Simochromis diagramma]
MMTTDYFLGGSVLVLLIVHICSLPLEKGYYPGTPYWRGNTNTAVQQPGVYQHAPQSVPVLYTGSSSSGPAQAGGYTTGSTQGGGAARPAAGSNVGVSTGGSGANTGANVALSQGGPYPYPSSVAVPYSAPYGGIAVQQPGFSHAAQSVAAPYTGSSYSAPAQAGGSTAGSAQTGATSQPAAEINWAVPPPKLGEESSPNPQSLASGTADEPGALLPPVPAYQPGELSHYEKAAEAGDYQSETEELGHRTVPATMDSFAAAGGLASPGFATGQFGMGGLWGSPYPSFDFLFLTGQYPVGTVSHFSQDYEQGRDYSHSTHYLKDHPYPGFAQSVGTVGAAQSLETPSLYVSSPVVGGYYQVGAQTVPASFPHRCFADKILAESNQLTELGNTMNWLMLQ